MRYGENIVPASFRFLAISRPLFISAQQSFASSYTPPASLPVLWCGVDNNVIDIIRTNDGTLKGVAYAGKGGQAFSFDGGDDYVEIPHKIRS